MPPLPADDDPMVDLSVDERTILLLVARLQEAGDSRPLQRLLAQGDVDEIREVLTILGEFDLDRLIAMLLEAFTSAGLVGTRGPAAGDADTDAGSS